MRNLREELHLAFGPYWVLASCMVLLPFFIENATLLSLVFTEKADAIKPMISYFYKSALMPVSMVSVTIPYATSVLQNQRSGSLKYVMHRCGVRRFVRDRFLSNAIAGASAIAVGQLLLFLFCCIVYPYPDVGYRFIPTGNPWQHLYYNQSGVYILLLIGLHFWGNMAWSSLALALSTYIRNVYATLFVPLIFVNALSALAITDAFEDIRTRMYLVYNLDFWKEEGSRQLLEYLGMFALMLLISYVLFYWGVRRQSGCQS